MIYPQHAYEIERGNGVVTHVFVANSEKYPLTSYTIRITTKDGKVVNATCECVGYLIKGTCKHINAAIRKLGMKYASANATP